MKLPEGKKERTQVFVLIGMGIVVILIMIVQFVIVPILAARRALVERQEEYIAKLDKARRELNASPRIQEEFDAVRGRLQGIASNYLLRPILGSMLVGVTEALEPCVHDSGFTVEDIQERGVQSLRLTAKDAGTQPYNAYSFLVNGQGSLEQISAFLRATEQHNPYICVTELKITAQSDSPLRHRASLRLEWPLEVARTPDATAKEGP